MHAHTQAHTQHTHRRVVALVRRQARGATSTVAGVPQLLKANLITQLGSVPQVRSQLPTCFSSGQLSCAQTSQAYSLEGNIIGKSESEFLTGSMLLPCSVPCHLFPAICTLSSVPCHLYPVICTLSSVPCHLYPVIYRLVSYVTHPFGILPAHSGDDHAHTSHAHVINHGHAIKKVHSPSGILPDSPAHEASS
eukprot:1162150-Pelagomonas_calceolata.AAC.7